MSAIDHTLFSGGIAAPLTGPDLDVGQTLADQLRDLDAALAGGFLENYVLEWLSKSDANGGYATAFWDSHAPSDAPADFMVGILCDGQERERRRRWQALHDHHQDVAGFREEMERELIRRRRFSDNRRTSAIELKAIVRAFIATGGRLLIAPPGAAGWPATEASADTARFLYGTWTEADQIATRAMFRLLRRWRAQPILRGIVLRLGQRTDNGWVTLEGETA